EDLLAEPQKTLDQISLFIDQRLDYEVIQRAAYGSVSKPNTSFRTESPDTGFNPVGRWKKSFTPEQLLNLERLVGKTLQETGYTLSTQAAAMSVSSSLEATRLLHRSYFEGKLLYKNSNLIRALRPSMTGADLDQFVLADNHPPEIKQPTQQSA